MAKRMMMKKMGDVKKLSPRLDTESAMYKKGGLVKAKKK